MRTVTVACVVLLIGACSPTGGDTTTTGSTVAGETTVTSPGGASTTTTTTSAGEPADRFAAFTPCDAGGAPGAWVCATLEVPIDRADPGAGSIPLKVWARPHTDSDAPPSDPVFMTPGGPGSPGLENYGVFWLPQVVGDSRDVIAIDPRGTGESGAIDCPDLQDGFDDLTEWSVLVGDCGALLGDAADRYGAADRAMDVEAVRAWLGYERIVYYGVSFGGVDAQAYSVRFPERVSALLLDASFPLEAQDDYWLWKAGQNVSNALRVSDLTCAAVSACADVAPDPSGMLTRLVEVIARSPLEGTSGDGTAVVVDETYLLEAVMEMDLAKLIIAAADLEAGNTQTLLDFAAVNPSWYRAEGYGPDPSEFSGGANVAGWCKEPLDPYDLADPFDVRRRKMAAAITELPADAFAPWSKEAAAAYNGFAQCVEWPAPDEHSEAAVPVGMSSSAFPVLALVGDLDRLVPIEVSRGLLEAYPDASFVVVAGAEHPTLASGACVANLIAGFLETFEPLEGRQCA